MKTSQKVTQNSWISKDKKEHAVHLKKFNSKNPALLGTKGKNN